MKVVVLGNEQSYKTLSTGKDNMEWVRLEDINAFNSHEDADAFFNLNDDAYLMDYDLIACPVIINSVIHPLGSRQDRISRINGWDGFLEKDSWELAGKFDVKTEELMRALGKKIIKTADIPGFISVRIIAMIINEAYFALSEDVSTEKEINIAMKYGTNYPHGPFEWAEIIGIDRIYNLLEQLAASDSKYCPAPIIKTTALKS